MDSESFWANAESLGELVSEAMAAKADPASGVCAAANACKAARRLPESESPIFNASDERDRLNPG
jgi:hypothetical protein